MANKRSLNRVILVGTVGRDPEITHIPSLDKDVAKFSMVTNEVFMDKSTNQFNEAAEWHNIVAWGWTAKKVERGVNKGTLVLVEGKIKTRKWKDKNDQDRRTTEIQADNVTVLDKSSRDGSYGGGDPGPQGSGSGYGEPPGGGGGSYSGSTGPGAGMGTQAPPEAQIDDINNIPYDDSDPF